MKIATRVFISSMAFGIVVGLIYWFVSYEPVGTLMLGLFSAGLAFVSVYLFVSRKSADVDGDTQKAPSELAGEAVGVFSTESSWPILLALAIALLTLGIAIHPIIAFFDFPIICVLVWRLIVENV